MSGTEPDDASSQQARAPRGAAAAQLGFDYQLDVSILAALQLLLVSKAADRLVLEPANDEDLEADLVEFVPGRMEPSAAMAGSYKLVIQVKFSGGEPWSIEDFTKLLEHGSDKPNGRRKALHHLDDPATRYLLVTSADAKGVARNLLVEGFEEASDKAGFPSSLSDTLKFSPEGRVAIWGKLTPKLLASTIREKMSDVLHVSKTRQDELVEELRREAGRRTRSTTPGIWTREDLLATIRKYGGFLSSSASLDHFVPPANFRDMKRRLSKGAVVIRGPSGTGKTEAARKLCDWARDLDGTLEVVLLGAADTPSAALKLVNAGPTLFYVDDPWGQYSLSGGAEAWTEQLPRLLRKANPGHQFIVTSRTDMMRSGSVGDTLDHWAVDLESKHYAAGQLGQIYDRRMDQLPPLLQAKAYAFRGEVLGRLENPLEIDIYFQHLQAGPAEGEADHAFLHRLLGGAHREAVADVVVKALDSIDDCGASAILWAILQARGQLDRGTLVDVLRAVKREDRQLSDTLEKLVDRMIAARFLRQPARTISFAHPSVSEGFEAHVKANWLRGEDALERLASALTQLPEEQANWGMETAARTLEVARGVANSLDPDRPFRIGRKDHDAIDAWLDKSLADPRSDFEPLLELAADVGSESSISSRMATWLLKGVQRGGAVFMDDWAPPEFDDAWYELMSGHPVAAQIADRFVREVLPYDRGSYDAGFVTKLDRIVPDLAPAYIDAALRMVGNGFETNADTVAAGAVRDLSAFENVLLAALDDLETDHRRYVEQGRAEWRAVEDGETDASAEEALRWQHEGEGYTSGIFVGAYVRGLRAAGRWKDIASHHRAGELIGAWSNAVLTSPDAVGIDELHSLLKTAKGSGDENLAWAAVREQWQVELVSDLEARLCDLPDDDNLRDELALCGLARAPGSLASILKAFGSEPARQIVLLADIRRALYRTGEETRESAYEEATAAMPLPLREISEAMPERKRAAAAVGEAALALLIAAADKFDTRTLTSVVPVIIASGGDASHAVRRWLELATDDTDALAAAEAATLIGDTALAYLALRHERADARREALLYLAAPMTAPLPPEILSLAKDPGNRVRRALISVLKNKPHPKHLDILIALTADTWSSAEPQYEEEECYNVAQEAVVSIADYAPLSDEVCRIILRRADTTTDRKLSQYALIVVANCGSPAMQAEMWNLVHIPKAKWIRLDALDALADAQTLDQGIVAQVSAEYLQNAPPILAVAASYLIGKHAPGDVVLRLFEEVASSNSRRALLLVGVAALAERDRALADAMLDLLEPGHAARQLLDARDPLPPEILDDLGEVRIREAVRTRLGDRIEPKNKKV